MSRLEGAGTLWRISQSLAVLGSSLLPPPVLQLVHHLPFFSTVGALVVVTV